MDQVKIGKFIAECRKNVNLTQKQLAEKLNITDRAVSKCETGLAMPDSSIMLDLCTILQITADELLRGEFAMPTSNRETEETDRKLTQKYSKQLFWLAKSIPLICGFLALLFSLFTDGVRGRIYEIYKFDRYGYIRIRLISFIFGGGTI